MAPSCPYSLITCSYLTLLFCVHIIKESIINIIILFCCFIKGVIGMVCSEIVKFIYSITGFRLSIWNKMIVSHSYILIFYERVGSFRIQSPVRCLSVFIFYEAPVFPITCYCFRIYIFAAIVAVSRPVNYTTCRTFTLYLIFRCRETFLVSNYRIIAAVFFSLYIFIMCF